MAMESALKARLVSTVVLVLVFGSGLSVGLALDRAPEAAATEDLARSGPQGDRRGGRERGDRADGDRRPLIVEQVGLTVEQKAQVDAIVEESRRRMKSLENETRPQYRTIIEETRTAIKEVLTDEQRTEYEALLAERDRERDKHRRGRSNSSRD